MSTWVKAAVAALVGGFLGSGLGNGLQSYVIFSIYESDNISREFMLSQEMGCFLGVFTGAALVFWRANRLKLAALFCVIGGALCLLWLSLDRDSRLFQWWDVFDDPYSRQSFDYWNTARDPFLQSAGNALVFNGVPLLWATILILIGLKWLHRYRHQATDEAMTM